jgi:hypothetical protein
MDGYVSKPADIEELLDRAAMTGVSELLPYDAFPRQLRWCSRVVRALCSLAAFASRAVND